jgi:hypothetical protein
MWKAETTVADWWARMRRRPSVKAAIFERMEESDWTPFKNLSPDPWPRVKVLLEATSNSPVSQGRPTGVWCWP